MYHFRFMMGYCYIHLNLWLNGSFKLSFMMCRLLRSHSHLMSHDSLYWGLTFQIRCSPLPKTSLSTRILGSELQLSYWGSPVILNILFLNKKFLSWYVYFHFYSVHKLTDVIIQYLLSWFQVDKPHKKPFPLIYLSFNNFSCSNKCFSLSYTDCLI